MAASSALDEETAAKVLRQVEFYFSDSNLPGDHFLLKTIEESDDELVPLSLVCSFTRMRSHLGVKDYEQGKSPPDKVAAVADVLRKSTTLRLSDDGTKVGRVSKLVQPETVRAEVDARSIAATPFPYYITMGEVEAFFAQHGEVKSVRLPRHATDRTMPSGYAVVEFSSEEESQKVMGMELICEGAELELEPKTVFDARKVTLPEYGGNPKQFGNNQFQRHDRQWNRRLEGGEEAEEGYTKGVIVSFTAKKIGVSNGAEKTEETTATATEGADVEEDTLTREDIKGSLGKFGIVRYVDYAKGEASGFVRFEEPEEAQKLRAAAIMDPEGGLTIAKYVLTFEALEGEAEKEYWKKLRHAQGQRRDFSGGRGFNNRGYQDNWGRGRGGGGRRGGRGGRGRGRSERDDSETIPSALGKHKRFNEGEDAGSNAKAQKT